MTESGNKEIVRHKPKVFHTIWWIPHYRSSIFRQMCKSPNIDFTVIAGDNSEIGGGMRVASAEDAGKLDGIKWRKVSSRHIKGPFFKGWEWQAETVKIVWKENIDVVIGLGIKSLSNWLIAVICRLRGIPYIDWSIGVMGPEKRLKWWIRKSYLKMAKAHLLYGNWAYNWYISHGFKKEQLFEVHNSLNHAEQVIVRAKITPDDIRQTREKFAVTGSQDRLLFHSGRIEKKKNLTVLFEAIKRFKAKGKNIRLVLIGEGQEDKPLREWAKKNNIEDRVVFYGVCYDEFELGKIISASDLCVVPGVTGLIAMHGFVYGTPVLTRENTAWMHGPEVDVVVEGKTGGYFKDNDIDDLMKKMEKMLYPVPCKGQMSEACKEIIEKEYTPEYQERTVIQALNYVLPPDRQIPVPGE